MFPQKKWVIESVHVCGGEQSDPNTLGSLFFGNRKTTGRGWMS